MGQAENASRSFPQKRRLIPIVDRRFQFKYTGIIVAVAAVISAVLGYFLLSSYMEMNEVVAVASEIPGVKEMIDQGDRAFVFKLTMGFLVLEVVLLGIWGLIITHRVAGPIFVLQRHLSTLQQGAFPQLRPLRQGDEFTAMFTTFQSYIERLKERDRAEVEQLKSLLAAGTQKGLADGDLKALRGLIDEREKRLQASGAQAPAA